ncbi:protein FAM163A [Trichomycterus rosablanca]|uniref:protein FAM163A n=1 Tax=Trichomycterus rosablanca TaxID=2290929 RepID=UPI002F35ED1F
MSAGAVVITGGVLAALILLCIITVLCYCRLQYYCCRRGDVDVGAAASDSDARLCSNGDVGCEDAAAETLPALTYDPVLTPTYCPACFMHYPHDEVCYCNKLLALPAPGELRQGLTALGTAAMIHQHCYTNTDAISTDV